MVNQSKPYMTEKEKEIFNLITKEKLTLKEIREKKKCSRQAVYKIVKRLRGKGFLPEHYRQPKTNPFLTFDIETQEVEYADHCYFCDSRDKLEEHHIIRKKDGGLNEADNILLLCNKCHKKLHKDFLLSFSKGYYIMVNRNDFIDKMLPNMRQRIRNFPKSSLNNAVSKGNLKIEK